MTTGSGIQDIGKVHTEFDVSLDYCGPSIRDSRSPSEFFDCKMRMVWATDSCIGNSLVHCSSPARCSTSSCIPY